VNVVDMIVLGLVIVNTVLGIVRGFALQAFRLGSIVLAIFLAHLWANSVADFLAPHLDWPRLQLQALGWVVIGGAAYLGMLTIGHYAKNLIQRLRMGGADRALGALLGGAKGLLISVIGLYIVTAVLAAGSWALPDSIKSELGTSQAFNLYSSTVMPWVEEGMKHTIETIKREAQAGQALPK
jgi:membrane protein required for colicin V production